MHEHLAFVIEATSKAWSLHASVLLRKILLKSKADNAHAPINSMQ